MVVSLLALTLGTAGCDEDEGDSTSDSGEDDGPSPTTSPDDGTTGGDDMDPPMWVVGEQGEMLRLDESGAVARYPLDAAHDFFGIACRGAAEAWVVGAEGTLLGTRDAGAVWSAVALPTTADLVAVALADQGPIWAVGDGVAFVASADGDGWREADLPVRSWTGVAVAPHGAYALLTDTGGEIWKVDAGGTASLALAVDTVLYDVALDGHGTVAVAVGELGTVVRSDDAGETFAAVSVATAADLHAVDVAGSGARVVAVGEGGVVVRLDAEAGDTVETLLDPSLVLRGIHLADGHGHALGDAGVLFETFDAGASWSPVALPTELTLHGIDHPGVPHA